MKPRMLPFLALLLAGSAAVAAPGQVLVVFKIEAQSFKDGLGQRTATTEAKIVPLLAAHLRQRFPPLEWLTTAPPGGAAATVTVSLVEDQQFLPEVAVKWAAQVGSQQLMLRDVPNWTIYDATLLDRPTRLPDQLAADIDSKVGAWIRSEPAEAALQKNIVKHIPLNNRIDLDQQLQAVLVPLSWKDSKLGDASQFRIEFARGQPAGDIKVLLGRVTEVQAGAMKGNTRSLVASCAANGAPVETNVWSNCIAILVGQNAPPFSLSLEHYDYSDHVSGVTTGGTGTAVTP